jgi:hypothetical protein
MVLTTNYAFGMILLVMDFANALDRVMNKKGWSNERLCVELSDVGSIVTAQSVQAWRVGRHEPRPRQFKAICSVLPEVAKTFLKGAA